MNFHILLCERVTWTSKSNITDCSIFIRLEIRPSAVWAASVSAPVLRNLKRIPLRVKTRFPARLRATIRSTMRTRSSKWTARRTHSKEVWDHCVILIFFFKDLHVLLCGYVEIISHFVDGILHIFMDLYVSLASSVQIWKHQLQLQHRHRKVTVVCLEPFLPKLRLCWFTVISHQTLTDCGWCLTFSKRVVLANFHF